MRIISIILSIIFISSCSLYRKFESPKIENDNICGDNIKVDTTSTLDSSYLAWQGMFPDTNLQSLITKALEENTDLKLAKLNIDQAEAALLSSKLSYLPSFFLSPQGGINKVGSNAASYFYNVPISAQWELDIWGRIRNTKEQSKSALFQSQEYKKLVQTQIVSTVANLYYTLIFLDQQLSITLKTVRNQKENLDVVIAMKEAGFQTETAVNQAQAAYYSILSNSKDISKEISLVENNLSLILNESPSKIARSSFDKIKELGIEVKREIPIVALANRPDVKISEYNLSRAFYGVNIARSAFYPNISIGAGIGWTNSLGGAIIDPAAFLYSAIASLTQPLFNKGINVANLKIAKAEYEKSLLSFEHSILSAGNEVNSILTNYFNSIDKVELRSKQVIASKQAYENSVALMQHSSMTYLEVLLSETMYLNAQLAQAADWLEKQQSSINLYRALGGGVE